MDDGRIGDEMTLAGIAKRLDEISTRLSSVQSNVKSHDGRFQALEGKLQSLDGKISALDHKMTFEFEETRRVVNLGFENVQMLDAKMDRRFDEADRAHADHKTLLEAAVASLPRDIKRPRRPGRR